MTFVNTDISNSKVLSSRQPKTGAEFGILGPLQIHHNNSVVAVTGGKRNHAVRVEQQDRKYGLAVATTYVRRSS